MSTNFTPQDAQSVISLARRAPINIGGGDSLEEAAARVDLLNRFAAWANTQFAAPTAPPDEKTE